jgi:hypothetical protein
LARFRGVDGIFDGSIFAWFPIWSSLSMTRRLLQVDDSPATGSLLGIPAQWPS